MKKKLKNILLAGFVGATLSLANTFQTNAQENHTPKYNTIGHEAIKIEGEIDSIGFTFKNLDNYLDRVNKNIEFKNKYTKEEAKNVIIKLDSLSNLDENKKINDPCYRENCFYLSARDLAEQKGKSLPIYAFTMSFNDNRHLSLRYDADGKHNSFNLNDSVNKGDFNYETIINTFNSDKEMLKVLMEMRVPMTEKSIKNRVYLDNLNREEFLSIAHINKALPILHSYDKKNYGVALKECKKAIELDSNSVINYEAISKLYSQMDSFRLSYTKKAIFYINKAIDLNERGWFYIKRAGLYRDLGDEKKYQEDKAKGWELIQNNKRGY